MSPELIRMDVHLCMSALAYFAAGCNYSDAWMHSYATARPVFLAEHFT